jgi:hypothetical protein
MAELVAHVARDVCCQRFDEALGRLGRAEVVKSKETVE